MTEQRTTRQVVPAEDLITEVEKLMQLAAERGIQARNARPRSDVATTQHPELPDITDLLSEDLRSVLEDEVVPTVPSTPGGILDWELEREITKKALIGLKVHRLKAMAVDLRLDKRGSREELADRIARAYKYDQNEIAQLILDNEEEPEPERGHTDRVFALMEPIDTTSVAESLGLVAGRFVRVGVARWFLIESITHQNKRLVINGTLRTYRTFVSTEPEPDDDPELDEDDDGTNEVARLNATPTETRVVLAMVDGRRSLRIQTKSVGAARGAARAIEAASKVRLLHYVPFPSTAFDGTLATFAPQTIFLLDLIDNRLTEFGATDPNLTVARFQMDKDRIATTEVEGDRPALREVRFEGDHLLDSVAACRLIGIDGRALIDLSLRVTFQDGIGEPARFPVRIGLERDHAVVLTGFGAKQPTMSLSLHQQLVRAVEKEFDDGVASADRLGDLADRITMFARANQETEHATMLRLNES